MQPLHQARRKLLPANGLAVMVIGLALATAACTSVGPSASAVRDFAARDSAQGIVIRPLDMVSVLRARDAKPAASFADNLGGARPIGFVVGPGDVLEVSIWEAPPATLFSTGMSEPRSAGGSAQAIRSTSLPEFLVPESGLISIPFAGMVRVSGRDLREIEQEIQRRLVGKAHLPQVLVRLVRNATATVTVVGDVSNSLRMPLSPKGERVLDALAAAGGTRQPVEKMTLQIARGEKIVSMPLRRVIEDPRQNVVLNRDDIITALFQPYSFTALGAAGKNAEIPFEATGLTLSQALGRLGGLQDMRADPKGVFVFRWVEPNAIEAGPNKITNSKGEIAVIYTLNLKDPASYFAIQNFAMQDKDVIYIANSPVAELQRFTTIIASTVLPAVSVSNSL